jgi:hypothetical protein
VGEEELVGRYREGFNTRSFDLRDSRSHKLWTIVTLNPTHVRNPCEQEETDQDAEGDDCGKEVVQHGFSPVMLSRVSLLVLLTPGPFQKDEIQPG